MNTEKVLISSTVIRLEAPHGKFTAGRLLGDNLADTQPDLINHYFNGLASSLTDVQLGQAMEAMYSEYKIRESIQKVMEARKGKTQ